MSRMMVVSKAYESVPMRREPTFSEGGSYELVVAKNFCLHKEAIETGYEIIKSHLATKSLRGRSIQVLDLACGGKPIIIADIMSRLSSFSFHYTGVDINPDQITACKQFSFAKNVQAKAQEGNVWELKQLHLSDSYDLVFIGLNTHHAVPEEIVYAARGIKGLLKPGGLLMNHDVFRPARYPYFRRPKVESMCFVSAQKLQAAGIPAPLGESWRGSPTDWREGWFAIYSQYMQQEGVDKEVAENVIQHMREWDFPVSMEEMARLLESVGFKTCTHSYRDCSYPCSEMFGMVVGMI